MTSLYPSHEGKSYTVKNISLANRAVPGGFTTAKALQPVCAGRAAQARSPVGAPRVPVNLSRALGSVPLQLRRGLLRAGETDATCKAKRRAVKHIVLSIFKRC